MLLLIKRGIGVGALVAIVGGAVGGAAAGGAAAAGCIRCSSRLRDLNHREAFKGQRMSLLSPSPRPFSTTPIFGRRKRVNS
jgi:hypothetical protein